MLLQFFGIISLLFPTVLCLDMSSMNLTKFVEISDENSVREFANIVYDKYATKSDISRSVENWVRRQHEDVKVTFKKQSKFFLISVCIQEEYKRFLIERKYVLSISGFNLKTEKMKVKKCLPKVLQVLAMRDLGYWEKVRRLKV